MEPKVYVQEVSLFWTKASRGIPASTARNAAAEAFGISQDALDQLEQGECYSQIAIRERDGFRPDPSVQQFRPFGRYEWASLAIKFLNNDRIIVQYKHNEGAPDRSHRPALVYDLDPDKLMRVKYNGRTSWPSGEWRYNLTVFNIVLTEHPSVGMFLAEPAKSIEDLADLW